MCCGEIYGELWTESPNSEMGRSFVGAIVDRALSRRSAARRPGPDEALLPAWLVAMLRTRPPSYAFYDGSFGTREGRKQGSRDGERRSRVLLAGASLQWRPSPVSLHPSRSPLCTLIRTGDPLSHYCYENLTKRSCEARELFPLFPLHWLPLMVKAAEKEHLLNRGAPWALLLVRSRSAH